MLQVEHLSKRYTIYPRPMDRLADWVLPERLRRGRPLWALRDLTFEVASGASMGVVGVNGAGKSTLLKIITGTTQLTEGSLSVEGRVSSLLELGTGFHPEFTGRQNIAFNGKMAGLSDEELAAKFTQILDFSELGDFIDQPVRTYSSGMVLRLGFALASSVEPEVLLIDEALSVGDLHFQQKCLRRIRKFQQRGTTILFVSHDPSLIKNFCTEAILLEGGRLIEQGKPAHVLDHYTAMLAEKYRDGGRRTTIVRPGGDQEDDAEAEPPIVSHAPPFNPTGHRTGNFEAVITSVYLKAIGQGGNTNVVTTGGGVTICVRWVALEPIDSATVGIAIKDRLGQEIFGVNTHYRDQVIGPVAPGRVVEASFELMMTLGEGSYSLTTAVHGGEDHTRQCYDWVEQALTFQVLPNPAGRFTGLCRLDRDVALTESRAAQGELELARATREGTAPGSIPRD